MTDEQIRIAVAEEMGWTDCHRCKSCSCGEIVGTTPDEAYVATTPNYPASLDACAEFEKVVPAEFYVSQLLAVIHQVSEDYFSKVSWENAYELTTATARQRCEAFLRIRGRYVE